MKVESSQNAIYLKEFEKTAPQTAKKTNEENAKQTAAQADKIEISQEAKMLMNKNVSVKDFETIKKKMESGYYNSPEVLAKVADAVIKDINKGL